MNKVRTKTGHPVKVFQLRIWPMRIGCVVMLMLAAGVVRAEDDEEVLAERAYKLAAAEAKSLTLEQGSQILKFESVPIMRWSNPVSGQVFGDVYVWTLQGRPEAIASIFKWFSPNTHLSTELQSLSESPLTMTKGNQRVWTPSAGVTMKVLPRTPGPRDRKFQRLQQMKALVKEFKAEAVDRSDPDKKWFLRPQSKPIFRYDSDRRGIIDGALFVFCQGNTTNPEVILMIEARKQGGDVKWYYGLGRQNSLQLRAYRNDELIWDVPRLAPPWSNIKLPDKPYINLTTRGQ